MSCDMQPNKGGFTETRSLSRGGERMRAHRSRRKAGLRCLTIELRETEVTELIRRKLLEADARHDAHAVRTALYRHLDATLGA
jgi:hypothetical protein